MLGRTLIALALLCGAEATPTGNHTCTGVVKHEVTVRVNVTEPVTFRAYEWCLRVPPRCSTYTIQLKDRVKIHKEMHNRTITVCCKGYVEIDHKCVPACPPETECPNMHCNRTNHCYCTPGYTGLYCNHACPKGVWGAGCIKPCDCPSGYTCHHLTGDCMIDDSPPSKTRRTTTSELLTEAATTLMTTQATQAPSTLKTTQASTTTTTTTTRPTTTTTSPTSTTSPTTTTTTTTTTTERPTTIPTTTQSTTLIPSTTPEQTEPTVVLTTKLMTTTTSTTILAPTFQTTLEETMTTKEPEFSTNKWQVVENIGQVTTTTSTSKPQAEEVVTIGPTAEAATIGTTQTAITTSKTTTPTPITMVHTRITDTDAPSTTSVYAPYTSRSPDIIPFTVTTQNQFSNDIRTTTTTGLPTTTIVKETPTSKATEAQTDKNYVTRKTTLAVLRALEPIVNQHESIFPPLFEDPLPSTTIHSYEVTEPTTIPQIYITPTTTPVIYTTPITTTVLHTTPTITTELTTSTTTEKLTTTAETTVTQPETITQMPIEQFSTEQVRTATRTVNTVNSQDKPDEKTTSTEDWEFINGDTKKTKMQVDDSFYTEETATKEPPTILKSTPLSVSFVGSKSTTPNVHKGSDQILEEKKYKKGHKALEKGTTVEETLSSTTDRLDRLIIEDVPKAPSPELSTDDNPIKIMEEVISKYFPDTFLKAAIEHKNKSEPLFEENNKEEEDKPLLPPWKVEKEIEKENPTGKEVGGLDKTGSTKSQDVVEPTTVFTTTKSTTVPTTTMATSTTTTPETSTMGIITPKVIVSNKNPDEIDLGGVIYRKMKLFPPAIPSADVTTAATLSMPVVTQSKEPDNKEATTPVSDRFKIYLPEYDKEAEDFETTETPNVKTFLPKFNFDKEEFDYGKQAQAKKAKQKEKDLKKYKVKSFEVTNAPVEDGSNERVTNNVFLETKEFKVHLASTKSQKFGAESYYTKAPIDQDSPMYDLSKLAKKKSKLGASEYEPAKFAKHTEEEESQKSDDVGTTQTFMETNYPTTNPKPPHTWYSHAREKAKIKNALKIMKSTMTLDMNVKPTEDSMMEESNDINSMATQYTDREPRSAVAAVTYQDDLNNPQMFGQANFNAPEGYAAAVSGTGADDGVRLGVLSSIAVGAACFMAMASLVAVLWLKLKTGRSRLTKTESTRGHEESLRPVATTSNYETVYPVPRKSDEYEVTTFFCPTFTNNYAERINREFNEMSYDHPRSIFVEPLYAEILHPKIKILDEEDQ